MVCWRMSAYTYMCIVLVHGTFLFQFQIVLSKSTLPDTTKTQTHPTIVFSLQLLAEQKLNGIENVTLLAQVQKYVWNVCFV